MILIRTLASACDEAQGVEEEAPFQVLHKAELHHKETLLLVEVLEVDEVDTVDREEERLKEVVEEAKVLVLEKGVGLACEEADRIAGDGVVVVPLGTWAAAACEEAVLACVVVGVHMETLAEVLANVGAAVAAEVVVAVLDRLRNERER